MCSAQKEWFQDGAPPEGLRTQEQLNRDHAEFRRRLDAAISNGAGVEVANSKDGLIRQIENARDPHSSRTTATQLFRRASAAHNKYVFDRETGSKGTRNWVQANTEVLLGFVEKFSKVIDAVATAGGPYSSVAYETLSIMVAVVRNKVDNDNKVVGLLDEIRKALPRLETWEQIYPTKTMRDLIVKIYERITDFSSMAAEYFTHFRNRLKVAIFPGFVIDFDNINAAIRTTLADINSEAMYGLHERTNTSGKRIEHLHDKLEKAELAYQELQTQNAKLLAQNESMRQRLDEQRLRADTQDKQEDERRLRRFSDFLKVPLNHAGTNVEATKETLMHVFPDVLLNQKRVPYMSYRQAGRGLLYDCNEYRRWHDAKEPSLLFISGGTNWYGRKEVGLIHCWLSPFTIYLAEDASRERNAIVTFFSVLPGIAPGLEQEYIRASTVIASIILQLIQRFPQMLREKDDEFRRVLSRHADQLWSTESLVDLLGRVISQLGSGGEAVIETIYIVIDRLDLCKPDSLSRVMASLLHMITALGRPSVGVKVAVVAETSEGNAEWRSGLLPELEFDPRRLVPRHDWIQEELSSWESHTASRPLIWSPSHKSEESSDSPDDSRYQRTAF